jgi:hypothetical protein
MDAEEIQLAIKNYDCPVICKSRTTLPRITITSNKILDKALLEKHGSIELYFFHKSVFSSSEADHYKRQNLILRRKLKAAKAVIDAYRKTL